MTREESQRVLALREAGPLAGVTNYRRSRRGDALALIHASNLDLQTTSETINQVLAHELLNSCQRRASQ